MTNASERAANKKKTDSKAGEGNQEEMKKDQPGLDGWVGGWRHLLELCIGHLLQSKVRRGVVAIKEALSAAPKCNRHSQATHGRRAAATSNNLSCLKHSVLCRSRIFVSFFFSFIFLSAAALSLQKKFPVNRILSQCSSNLW